MVKIYVSKSAKDNFNKQVMNNFWNPKTERYSKRFEKKENKKLNLSKSLAEINRIIKNKLKGFDNDITLQKLILADYKYLSRLVKYLDKHKRTELKGKSKDIFLTLYSRLKKADFIRDVNIKVCPYCNRNYIFNFTKMNKLEATAQLDHFFDKKSYPYLAVSLYNLVPSCGTCNQRKSTKQENIFYPYDESFNDSVKFTLKGIKQRVDLQKESKDFFDESRIEFDFSIKKDKAKVDKHIEVFNIKNLYNEHKDIVSELLQKRVIYSDDYINSLLNDYEGKLFNNKEDLLRLITGGYIKDEDLHKRPLSKLTKDISDELGLR